MKFNNPITCINYYEEIYDAKHFIELITEESKKDWPRLGWNRSAVGGLAEKAQVSEHRSSMSMSLDPLIDPENIIDDLKDIQNIFLPIWREIDKLVWDYRHMYSLHLEQNEGLSLLKYSNGAEYHLHSDAGTEINRQLSLVAYINDDYDGGELEFPNFKFKIKPSAGSVILFPSSYAYSHMAHPVTKGTKYSIVTWFR